MQNINSCILYDGSKLNQQTNFQPNHEIEFANWIKILDLQTKGLFAMVYTERDRERGLAAFV